MKIITNHYGYTEKKEAKYLIYLQNDDGVNIEAHDVEGDLNRIVRENELLEDNDIDFIRLVDYNTFKLKNGQLKDGYPLILCFYLDNDVIRNGEIMDEIVSSTDKVINAKDANIITFFLPCEAGEDRIECINPLVISDNEIEKVDKLLDDLNNKFVNV